MDKPFSQEFPAPREPNKPSTQSRMTPEQRLDALAFRRAGYAVALVAYRLELPGLSLLERPKMPRKMDRQFSELYVTADLAGWAAERRRHPGQAYWLEEGMRDARRIIQPWADSAKHLESYCTRLRLNASKLVADPVFWYKTQLVALELLSVMRLTGDDIKGVCQQVDDRLRP